MCPEGFHCRVGVLFQQVSQNYYKMESAKSGFLLLWRFRPILSVFFHSWILLNFGQELFLNNTMALFATSKTSFSWPLLPVAIPSNTLRFCFTLGMSSKSCQNCFWTTLWLLLLPFHVHLDVNVLQELVLYNTVALFATPAGAGPLIVGGSEFPRKSGRPEP